MKGSEEYGRVRFGLKQLNTILAYAASLVLTGIPAEVCESVLDELYCSVKKSMQRIAM